MTHYSLDRDPVVSILFCTFTWN